MKRIFLTSGMVICLACSAFADPGIVTVDDSTIPPTVTAVSNAGCDNSTLGVTSGSASLQAVWEPSKYTLIYAAGSGCVGTSVSTSEGVTYAASYTPQAFGSSTPINISGITADTGHHFSTWNDGTVDRAPGTEFTYETAGDLTLTAVCPANETTVIYKCGNEANGYNGPITGTAPSSNTATYDSNFVFQSNTDCAKPGYTFAGWSCPNLGNTVQTAGGNGSTSNYAGAHEGSIECTAVFTANQITLTWENGIDGTVLETNTCNYDGAITLPQNPTRTGYTFAGWEVVDDTSNS